MSESDTFSDGFSGCAPANPILESDWIGGFQKHHLIPTAEANDSALLCDLSERGLYAHSEFRINGLYLPENPEDAAAAGLARHSGRHTAYSDFVRRILEEFEIEFERAGRRRRRGFRCWCC